MLSLDNLYFKIKETGETGASGGSVTINAGKIGTPLVSSPDVFVEKVYFNTELSIEEVKNILSGLTYVQADMETYGAFSDANMEKMLAIGKNANDYLLMDGNGTVIFATADLMGMGLTFTGWNPNFVNPVIFNTYGVVNAGGLTIGADNDKLTNLISMNNEFERGSATLTGEYDGSPITTNESVNLQDYIDNGKLPMRINVEDKLVAWSTRQMTEVNYHAMTLFGYGYLVNYEITSQSIKKLVINNLPLLSIQEFSISDNKYLEIIDLTFCTLNEDMFKAGFSYNSFRNNYSLKHILFRGVEASFFANNDDAHFTNAIEGCCYFDGSGIDFTDLSGNNDLKIESGQRIGKIYVPDDLVETAKAAWTSWADMIYPISDYVAETYE